jgi:hypothetical protein
MANELTINPPSPAATPMELLRVAMTSGANVDQLERLMLMQERWQAGEAKKAFDAAMADFKSHPPRINKNRHVKFGNTEYKHATLDHVVDVVTDALSRVGIAHKWAVKQSDAEIAVTCILTHQMGHSEATTLSAKADASGSKNSIQAIGSTVTYLQRYTLLAATGLAAADSDNDGASFVSSLPLDDHARYLEQIETAPTLEALQRAFAAAYTAAKAAKDNGAMAQFSKAKDTRKGELQ